MVFSISMRIPVIFLLMLSSCVQLLFAQESYNACGNALELCPNTTYSVNNIDANVTFCGGCEDDFVTCFSNENTIWLSFTTNAIGGDVQIDFSNLVFELNPNQGLGLQATILEAPVPCSSASYTPIGNCEANAVGNFALNAVGLPPNTTYYIVVDGDDTGAGVTSAAECTFDISLSGTAVDRPVPSIEIDPVTFTTCENAIAYLSAILENCPDSTDYSWYVNGNLTSVTELPELQIASLQDGDIITVENSCFSQCVEVVSATSLPISVYSFNLDAGEDQVIYAGSNTILNGTTSAPDYSWSPTFLLSDPSVLNPVAAPTQTTTYTLTATENGCTQTDYVTIVVIDDLIIPNTISPNGDNINDTWIIEGIENYPNSILHIYSRWGQEVFQTTGYSKSKAWDGALKSGELAEGVYYYVLDLELDNGAIYKGSITVIR